MLHDVRLKVKPRQVVALVGPTGSGKTSIISLVRRFYEVDQGAVLVGGHDVRDVTPGVPGRDHRHGAAGALPVLRHHRGEHPLQHHRRHPRAGDRRGQGGRAPTTSSCACREGYDTQLGQRGRNLSVGQRQLLSFARALVADPTILILDEATANIDSFTELEIQRALKVLFAGRTCLVIAHRLATVRDADEIIVLQQGRIVEQGPHDALMARGGLYATLYASSHGSFDDLAGEGAGVTT